MEMLAEDDLRRRSVDRDSVLQVLLAEYESVNTDIREQIGFQTQVFAWAAAALAVIAAAVLGGGQQMPQPAMGAALAIICILSCILGLFLVDKDRFVLAHIDYIDSVLRQKVIELVGCDVLGLYSHRRAVLYGSRPLSSHWWSEKLTSVFPHVLFLLVSFGAMAGFVYSSRTQLAQGLSGQGLVWWAGVCVLALSIAWLIAGMCLVGAQWQKLGQGSEQLFGIR